MHKAQVAGTQILYNARVQLALDATSKVNNFLETATTQAEAYLLETAFIPQHSHQTVLKEFKQILAPELASIRLTFSESKAKKEVSIAKATKAKAQAKDSVMKDPTGNIKHMIHNEIANQLKKQNFQTPSQSPGKQGKKGQNQTQTQQKQNDKKGKKSKTPAPKATMPNTSRQSSRNQKNNQPQKQLQRQKR